MVKYTLYLRAKLEGVSSIQWKASKNATTIASGQSNNDNNNNNDVDDNEDLTLHSQSHSNQLFCCTVRHPLDPIDVKEKVVVDFSQLESSHSAESTNNNNQKQNHTTTKKHHQHQDKPGHLHLTWSDGSTGTIRVLLLPNKGAMDGEVLVRSDTWFPVLTLECENVEPCAFHPLGNEFMVVNHLGNVYTEVDLSSGDWTEYDLSAGSTSILQLESKFE